MISPVEQVSLEGRSSWSPAAAPAYPVAQIVAFLVSPACTVTGEAFTSMAGCFSRVVVAVSRGWAAPRIEDASAEAIAQHLDEICDLEGFRVGESLAAEHEAIAGAILQAESVEARTPPRR
jgi:hypothetical protein